MKFAALVAAILISLSGATIVFAQANEKGSHDLPVVNHMATYLPDPSYPIVAKNACIRGKVEVEVRVIEDGTVTAAIAISGHKLLRQPSVQAAKKATFKSMSVHGPAWFRAIVVYDFDRLPKCVEVGIVNKKAISIPKPYLAKKIRPSSLGLNESEIVNVAIVIDESGRVVWANAETGHHSLRPVFERSARAAKFHPTLISGIRVKAILKYTVRPDGTIEC